MIISVLHPFGDHRLGGGGGGLASRGPADTLMHDGNAAPVQRDVVRHVPARGSASTGSPEPPNALYAQFISPPPSGRLRLAVSAHGRY
ncbi:hypothetical protein EYF80_020651 [Liparis tanakae]|uniref:Uncharacterized protein n=1 Tax=Liparis tanakae TaxID=230148 RepID=A0A4Z2HVZ2_9TELE|nr:hypothetical protein EYF80_020651 [Liparis tanakae]